MSVQTLGPDVVRGAAGPGAPAPAARSWARLRLRRGDVLFVGMGPDAEVDPASLAVLDAALAARRPGRVVLDADAGPPWLLDEVAAACARSGAPLRVRVGGREIPVRRTPPGRGVLAAKRAVDVAVAGLMLLILAPLLLALALAVVLRSPGPALFRQQRIGRHGRPFTMTKFRTMVVGAEGLRAALLAESIEGAWLHLKSDPRVTPVGRVLRRLSLDELPQLLDVLRGDMSLVGPRPLIPDEHANVPRWARPRDEVKPGITGLWQTMGRTDIPFDRMLLLDRLYVATWSPWRDLAILVRTVPAVLGRRGAN